MNKRIFIITIFVIFWKMNVEEDNAEDGLLPLI